MRTWVSAAGDDMRSCSRTEPCRSFNRAITETAAGGEINCLDPGEYARFTLVINKSITIDCEGTLGAIHGIAERAAINILGAGVVVALRNLSIHGGEETASVGVNFGQEGSVLRIQNSKIFGFRTGVAFAPTAVAKLFIENSTISENETGIRIAPAPIGMTPTGRGVANVVINQVRVQNNADGILADSTFGRISMAIQDSEVSGNSKIGVHAKAATATAQQIRVNMDRTTCVNNDVGIVSEGASARVTLTNSMIAGNFPDLSSLRSGVFHSYKTNYIETLAPQGPGPATTTIIHDLR
jgi:hypothetical protein